MLKFFRKLFKSDRGPDGELNFSGALETNPKTASQILKHIMKLKPGKYQFSNDGINEKLTYILNDGSGRIVIGSTKKEAVIRLANDLGVLNDISA